MKVLRAFKTPARRFSVGMVVTPADIDGPMAFEDWVAGGFIESDAPVAAVAKAAPEPVVADVEPIAEPAAAEPEAPFFEDHTKE